MTGHISIHHFNEGAGRRMIGQKTFVSTCQFQPKRVPVKYTETLVLHLNSTKRKYYESISYETKMVPSQWSQTMYLDIVTGEDRIVNEIHIPCENYVSLIPQQVIAQKAEHESQLKDSFNNSNNEKQLNGANIKSEEINETKEIKKEIVDEKSIKNIPVQNKHHRAGRNDFNDIYCKNTCEEFLNELRKVY